MEYDAVPKRVSEMLTVSNQIFTVFIKISFKKHEVYLKCTRNFHTIIQAESDMRLFIAYLPNFNPKFLTV